jgi:hypothetical protein
VQILHHFLHTAVREPRTHTGAVPPLLRTLAGILSLLRVRAKVLPSTRLDPDKSLGPYNSPSFHSPYPYFYSFSGVSLVTSNCSPHHAVPVSQGFKELFPYSHWFRCSIVSEIFTDYPTQNSNISIYSHHTPHSISPFLSDLLYSTATF